MCESCQLSAAKLGEAIDFVDELLFDAYRIDVTKVLDPANPNDFLVIQRRITSKLAQTAAGAEGKAIRGVLRNLDVDWRNISQAQRDQAIRATRAAVRQHMPPKALSQKIEGVARLQGRGVAAAAKKGLATQLPFSLSTNLTAIDQKILNSVAFNQAASFRDEIGRRSADVSRQAKGIVASGMERGLGREAMMQELQSKLGKAWDARSANYWRTMGNYTANTARTYGSLSMMQSAGVEKYTIVAVVDKATTPHCRFMDGKVFEVNAAISNIEGATAAAPLPWMYEGRDSAGDPVLYHKNPSGGRTNIARVVDRGGGRVDDHGKFSARMTDSKLQAAGIDTPPFHGNCRTTIKADMASGFMQAGPPTPPGKPAKPAVPGIGNVPVPPGALNPHAWARSIAKPMEAVNLNVTAEEVYTWDVPKRARAAAAKVRKGTRELLKKNYNLEVASGDAHGTASWDTWEDSLRWLPDDHTRMVDAAAFHRWNGEIYLRESVAQEATDGIAKLAARKGKKTVAQSLGINAEGEVSASAKAAAEADYNGLSTLVHEEIHGLSRAPSKTYRSYGVGMEEASTETLARKVVREQLGFSRSTGKVPWSLPRIQVTELPHGHLSVNAVGGHTGSYNNYIRPMMKEIAAAYPKETILAEGFSETLAKNIERAFIKSKQGGKRFKSAREHIQYFVKQLDGIKAIEKRKLVQRLAPKKHSKSVWYKKPKI